MAKSTGGLMGRADATLVGAATKAAAANTPKDLSRVHERMAKSYAATAKNTGQIWSKAIATIGQVGSALINKAKVADPESPDWNQDMQFETKPSKIDFRGEEMQMDPKQMEGRPIVTELPGQDGVEVRIDGQTDILQGNDIEIPSYTHKDINGNTTNFKPQTTGQFIDGLREMKLNVGKDDGLNPSTGLKYTRQEKREEKRRLDGVMENVRKNNVEFAASKQNLLAGLSQEGMNINASGAYNLPGMLFAQAMVAEGQPVAQKDPEFAAYDGARAIQGYTDNGDMIFTYVDKFGVPFKSKDGDNMTIGKDDLNSLFVPKSPKRAVFETLVDPTFIRQGAAKGYSFTNNQANIKKVINEQVTDKNTFLDLAFHHGFNTQGSLSDSLHGVEYDDNNSPIIVQTQLSGRFIQAVNDLSNSEQYDQDGDGRFDGGDFATQENYIALVKQALSGEDLELGKMLLREHYEYNAKNIYNEAVRLKNPIETQTAEDYMAMIKEKK